MKLACGRAAGPWQCVGWAVHASLQARLLRWAGTEYTDSKGSYFVVLVPWSTYAYEHGVGAERMVGLERLPSYQCWTRETLPKLILQFFLSWMHCKERLKLFTGGNKICLHNNLLKSSYLSITYLTTRFFSNSSVIYPYMLCYLDVMGSTFLCSLPVMGSLLPAQPSTSH